MFSFILKKENRDLLTKIITGLFLSALSLYFFLEIAEEVVSQDLLILDTQISNFVYSFRSEGLTKFMYIISFLGNEFILILSTFVVGFLSYRKHKKEALLFVFIIALGYLLNSFLKYLLQIPRPTINPLHTESFYSFPSGHSMNSFIFYSVLSYFTFHFTRNILLSTIVSILSCILIFLIGFSRVYLGVHYPSDVIAGFIAGFWWFVTAIFIDKTRLFYKIYRNIKIEK